MRFLIRTWGIRNMSENIYKDENNKYKFDFSDCKVFEYHSLSQKTTILSDVDFVINSKNEIIFLEYKNAAVKGVVNPDEILRKLKTEEFYRKVAKKFYSSLFLHWACRENENDLPINYILLVEHPEIDGRLRKILREKIFKQLPINLKDNESIKRNIMNQFNVYNFVEWHKNYPQFKITSA
jgi:hypothetical protein